MEDDFKNKILSEKITFLENEIANLKNDQNLKLEELKNDYNQKLNDEKQKHKSEIEWLKQELEKKDQGMDPLKDLLKFQSTFKTIDKDHEKHSNYLMTLLNLNSIDQLTKKLHLLYRGSEHKFDSSIFHQLCDGKGKTLVLVRSKTKNLFGGYATKAWHSNNSLSSAPGSFLFSLDKQTIHTIYQNEQYAIQGQSSHGPIFGAGPDLVLSNNCHSKGSSTDLGGTYSLPPNISYDTNESQSYLAGSWHKFQVEEYEVFLIDNI